MSRCKKLLRIHWAALALALVVSGIVAAPQVYFRIEHKSDSIYQGIELLPDSPWSARVREVQDGHPSFGSLYYKEGKSDPYLFQPVGSMTVAYMGALFSLDINNTILLSRVVLSFAAFLLLYAFVFLLSREKWAALAAAAVILLADHVLSYGGAMALLHGTSPGNFLEVARPVNTAMIYIPLFGFLTAFWLFYQKRTWAYGVLSAVLLGLNFYTYFYSWTSLYAFGGFLGLSLLLRKQWKSAWQVASVFLGALLVAVPYGLNLYRSTLHPAYAEVSVRFGVVATHAPLFIGLTALGALLVFLFWFPKENRERYFFGLALLLAPFVTLNQQLLTGKVMQAAHYHWYFHKPMAVVFVLLTLFYVLERRGWGSYKKPLAIFIILASVSIGIFTQADSYLHDRRDGSAVAVERQKYGPVVQWLNQNANKEEVVLSNDEASHMVVIYTPLNVFYHRAAMYSLSATTERLLDVVFSFYRLRGVDAKDVEEIFFAERGYLSSNIYGMHYREVLGSYEAIPDEKIRDIIARYKETLSTPTATWFEQTLKKYEVQYVVWDKKKDPLWQLQRYGFLEEVAAFGDLAVYRFNP